MSDDRLGANPRSTPPALVPDAFPFAFENPDDAALFWTRDRMHMPDPLSPMEYSLNRLMDRGSSPKQLINGYLYTATLPKAPPTPEEEAESQRQEEQTQARMAKLEQLWQQEWLPEIQTHIAFWDGFDLGNAGLAQLLEHWTETTERFKRLWELHFQIVVPAKLAIGMLDDLYQDLFGHENAFAAYELLEGLPNRTTAVGRDLWSLSRQVLQSPEIREAVETGPWPDVARRLDQSESGRSFRALLDDYLAEHGQRSDRMGVRSPAWLEDPMPVLETLRGYLHQPERDLIREMADAAARREHRIEEVRSQLSGYPAPVVSQFEFLLKAAQAGNVIGEDHNYWIDFRSTYCMRRVLLEFGRRLAQSGVLAEPEDVFFLTLDEVLEIMGQISAGATGISRAGEVAQRQADFARFAKLDAPAALGTPPPPSDAEDTLSDRTFRDKFMGNRSGGPSPAGILTGNAGSPGVVQGPARVVQTLKEAAALQPGEILVTVTTMPAWTPLFATAAAVVTDTGGILSHCAVVAREYGIPAVVGAGAASRAIETGDMIEVDGNTGAVRILG